MTRGSDSLIDGARGSAGSSSGATAHQSTALLIVDLQNDFLHSEGAYTRGGASAPALTAVVTPAAELAASARAAGVPVLASLFTLVDRPDGQPLIAPHLASIRPFLKAGDFAPGSWGQASLDEIGKPDATVEKVTYSAFAHTRLGWWLERVGIEHLVVCGIVTNGGVAATVHDAHVRGFDLTVVSDACAGFDRAVHEATLISLGSISTLATSAEVCARWAEK